MHHGGGPCRRWGIVHGRDGAFPFHSPSRPISFRHSRGRVRKPVRRHYRRYTGNETDMTFKKSAALTALMITCAVAVVDVASGVCGAAPTCWISCSASEEQEAGAVPGWPAAAAEARRQGAPAKARAAAARDRAALLYLQGRAAEGGRVWISSSDPVVTRFATNTAALNGAHAPRRRYPAQFVPVKALAPAESGKAIEDFYSPQSGSHLGVRQPDADRARAALGGACRCRLDRSRPAGLCRRSAFRRLRQRDMTAARYRSLPRSRSNMPSAGRDLCARHGARPHQSEPRSSATTISRCKNVNLVAAPEESCR